MTILAKLSAILSADTSRFDEGFKRSGKTSVNFAKTVKRSAQAASAGIGLVTAAMTALTVRQSALIDQTAKTSDKLGVATEELVKLRLAAEQTSGLAAGSFDTALQRMTRRVAEAAKGTGVAKDSLEQLGINIDELSRKSPDEQFREIAEAMKNVSGQGEKVRLTFSLFDTEGVALVNTLGLGRDGLEQMGDMAERLGLTFSRVDAAKIEEANDTIALAGKSIGGLGNILAVEFAPLLTAMGEQFLDSGMDAQSFGESVRRGMVTAASGIDFFRKGFAGIELLIAEASILVDRFILDTTVALFKLAQAAESIPIIADSMVDAQKKLLILNEAAQLSGIKSHERIEALKKDIADFIPLAERLERLRQEAEERARAVVAKKGAGTSVGGFDGGEIEDFSKKAKDAAKEAEKLQDEVKKSAREVTDAFIQGGDAADVLKDKALSAISKIAESVINNLGDSLFKQIGAKDGGGAGGAIGSAISGLVGSAVSGVGSFLGGFLPSFDVGSFNVPSDMMANIHKGEMIIPAREAAQIRSGNMGGGDGVTIMQNVTIGDNVTAAVRTEISKAMPELREASIQAVMDAKLRGVEI